MAAGGYIGGSIWGSEVVEQLPFMKGQPREVREGAGGWEVGMAS